MSMTPSNSDSHDEDLPISSPIAVSDVLALQVPIHWAEAVAVIEELCEVLGDARGSAVRIPDLEDIAITARGSVMLRRGAPATQDIDGLGRALHALLDPAATPMSLRLFVAQSSGSEKYHSVSAYASALAYYSRPDRSELIQSLYRRCLEAPVAATLPPLPPPEIEEPPASPRRVPRGALVAAVALLCGAGVTSALWMWSEEARASAPVTALREAMNAAVAVVQNLGSSSSEPVAKPESPAPATAKPPTRRGDRDRPVPPVADVIVNATPLLAPPFLEQPATEATFDGGLATPPSLANLPAPDDATIYARGAGDVQPPVLFSPKLPPIAPAPPYAVGTNTMELLIDEAGFVRQVRMTSTPTRLPDMMLLSGAKTWRFHPALKNGKPVKYRLSVSWIVAPP